MSYASREQARTRKYGPKASGGQSKQIRMAASVLFSALGVAWQNSLRPRLAKLVLRLCSVPILYICPVSTADICPVSAADICPVSTADICPVSTEDIKSWLAEAAIAADYYWRQGGGDPKKSTTIGKGWISDKTCTKLLANPRFYQRGAGFGVGASARTRSER